MKSILTFCFAIMFIGCFQISSENSNELIAEFYNPKQSMKVIVFEKGGNAMTSNSLHASIEGYDFELQSTTLGNIFIADNIDGISKDSLLGVKWIDNQVVEITHNNKLRVFKKKDAFKNTIGNIQIEYVKK